MSIEFQCYSCGTTLRVADGSGGKMCRCPNCQTALDIPAEEKPADLLVEIPCPQCANTLLYSAELEGTRGMCKACSHIFTISANPTASARNDGSFPFECPHCNHLFEGKEGMQGKRGKCENCSKIFEIRPTQVKPLIASPPSNGKSTNPRTSPIHSTKFPNAKSQATSHAKPSAKNPAPHAQVQAKQPQRTGGDAHSVWDSIALPNDISQSVHGDVNHQQGNPYAAFPIGSGSSASSSLFKRCFKLSQKNLVTSTVMMFVANLASSALMMLLLAIPIGIIYLLGESLAIREWPRYLVGLFMLAMMIPMYVAFFYFLPAYWNIADRSVRGKEVTFDAVTERSDLAPSMFVWTITASLVPVLVCLMIGLVFGIILFGAATAKSTGLVMIVAIAMYIAMFVVGFVTVSPLMLVPFALIDGNSLLEAISISLKLSFRHPSTFYLLTFVALAIGTVVSMLSCGVLSIFAMTFLLMNHAAFYKLTSRLNQ